MTQPIFLARVALRGGQIPRAIDDAQIGGIEMGGKPFGADKRTVGNGRHDRRSLRIVGETLSHFVIPALCRDPVAANAELAALDRSEEHTSELQSLMRIS